MRYENVCNTAKCGVSLEAENYRNGQVEVECVPKCFKTVSHCKKDKVVAQELICLGFLFVP